MTLPSITQKIDKQITVSKLKKSFSTLQQVVRLSEKDNGEVSEWDFPTEANYAANESEFFKKYFEPYFKVVGKDGSYAPAKEVHQIYNIDGDLSINVLYWHILPDGSAVGMFSNVPVGYIWIFIDINSNKGPNKLGKDVFMTELYMRKRIEFWGYAKDREHLVDDTIGYSCKKGTHQKFAGGYCGKLIQYGSWEIEDDYPW